VARFCERAHCGLRCAPNFWVGMGLVLLARRHNALSTSLPHLSLLAQPLSVGLNRCNGRLPELLKISSLRLSHGTHNAGFEG
jgi:hypothetical protein